MYIKIVVKEMTRQATVDELREIADNLEAGRDVEQWSNTVVVESHDDEEEEGD